MDYSRKELEADIYRLRQSRDATSRHHARMYVGFGVGAFAAMLVALLAAALVIDNFEDHAMVLGLIFAPEISGAVTGLVITYGVFAASRAQYQRDLKSIR